LTKAADPYFVSNHIGAAAVTFTYDRYGQRSTMSDAAGTTSWVQYDSRGRVQQVGGPAGGYFYVYDLAGNLKQIGNTKYTYDALNRLSTVTAQVGGGFPTVAAYGYDNVGNLATVTYANGVVHTYSYDNRNRLNNLGVATGSANLFGYTYTVDAAGHRTSVTEQSGRTVNYSYDDLYRLTNETIAGGAGGMNGSVTYSYDAVGNRKQKVSTLPGYPGALTNYNANDQLTTDTYDASGNTTASGSTGYVYDFENHLISANGITYVYDGDGHRVSKTVNGTTTSYATTDINPTGYSQVVGESYSPRVNGTESQHSYIYGLDAALELRSHYDAVGNNLTQQVYFVHDGHGSARAITDQTGAVTDTYDYDAFGVLIHQTGTSPNTTLYSGEQFDPDLGLYFNRARYLNTSTGRFWSMDTEEGNDNAPLSLHKYLYASADPVDRIDPNGTEDLASLSIGSSIANTLNNITAIQGQAVLDQLQFGGNAGLKSLLIGTGFLVGSVVVFKAVGGVVRRISAAVYSLDSKIACQGFSRAAEWGVLPFEDLAAVVPTGSGLQKHHLIEQRFAGTLGVSAADIPAIALTPSEHQVFTSAWRDVIGYTNSKNPITTATATVDDIWNAAQQVYAAYPRVLEFIQRFMNK
jgi:RHS repeat-associated protein